MLAVLQRIWLWYDYSCLPQRDVRTTDPLLLARFKSTLQHLPQLQTCMHTVSMNSSNQYFQRAWCMSEYISAKATRIHGRSQYQFTPSLGMSEQDQVAFRWFELLINPTLSFSEVLRTVSLEFTNPLHGESNTPEICWIAWNSILRREHFQLEYFSAPNRVADELHDLIFLVGCGAPQKVVVWLACIRKALTHPIQQTHIPLWVALGSGADPLGYSQDEWIAWREAAGGQDTANVVEIVEPFDCIEGTEPSFLVEAIDRAIEKVERISHGVNATDDEERRVKVFLRNDCQRTLTGDNQDAMGFFEPY